MRKRLRAQRAGRTNTGIDANSLSTAQGYVFAGLAAYRRMVMDATDNDITAQKSLNFMWDLVQKRAKEIKEQVCYDEE